MATTQLQSGTLYTGHTRDSDYSDNLNYVMNKIGVAGNIRFISTNPSSDDNIQLELRYTGSWMDSSHWIMKSGVMVGTENVGVAYKFFVNKAGDCIAMSWGSGRYGCWGGSYWSTGLAGTTSTSGDNFGFIMCAGTPISQGAASGYVLGICNYKNGATEYSWYDSTKSDAFDPSDHTNCVKSNQFDNSSANDLPYVVAGPIWAKHLDNVPATARVIFNAKGDMGTENDVSIGQKIFYNIEGILLPES